MRLYRMVLLRICVCCLFFVHSSAQTISISGPTQVTPGSITTYTVEADTVLGWSVNGGTVQIQSTSSCQVLWNNTNGVGTVGVSVAQLNPPPGQPSQIYTGSLNVQIGNPTVTVSPAVVNLDYGAFVNDNFAATVVSLISATAVKWQSLIGSAWTDMTTGSYTYTPSSTANGSYRCVVTINGVMYFSAPAQVILNPLDPGSISLAQQPAYGAAPVLSYSNSHGGMCGYSSRTYVWERSVDGQPWETIGTGIFYPSTAGIIGNSDIRRKVTCNGVTLSTNILHIVPSYTSVDFENLNYVRVIDVHVAGTKTWNAADQLSMDSKFVSTTYLDGLGRPIQKIAKSASFSNNAWVDLVQPIEYDAAGRSAKQYLPYPSIDNPGKFKSANVPTQQASFVAGKFGEPTTAPTYSQLTYDNSPLNRVTDSYLPGQSWKGNSIGVHTDYDFNTSDENVHIWSLTYSTSAIPSTSPTVVYPTGSLYKLTSTDEKGKKVITYTDFTGNTLLKKVQEKDDAASGLTVQHAGWICTYYVYDDLNQLRFTITPKAVAYLDNNAWALTQQLVNDLCFVYGYDAKGRVISKKQPGIGETNIVYDQRDRPVFMQDANGRLVSNQWQATLYDGLDRVTSTGILTQSITQASLQTYVDNNTGRATITGAAPSSGLADLTVSSRQAGLLQYVASHSITFLPAQTGPPATPGFTTEAGANFIAYIDPNLGVTVHEVVVIADNPIPAGTFATLTQNFYDDYSQATKAYTTADNALFDPSTNAQALALPTQASPQTRGFITTTKVRVITNPSDLTQGSWLETDSYYDDLGRAIQDHNDNGLGGTDIVTKRYDFAGKLWGSCVKHMAGAASQFTVVSKNSYDQVGRLTALSKNFNNTFFKNLASYTYDEYGKMVQKKLAPGYNGTQMETLSYDYNIQGWLTGINKDYATSTNTYAQWDHFFGLYLGYDNRDNQFAAQQFNGSITGAIWKSQGDNSMQKYDYTYDNLGRFTSAIFNQRKTPADGWSNSAINLSEYVTYKDGNGNINTIKHWGVVPGTAGGALVDDLQYTYGTTANPNTNRLTRVDATTSIAGDGQLNDFKDGTNTAAVDDYQYDNNGSLIQDLNKGMTDGAGGGVLYNYLNKPVKITIAAKSIVEYTYDATGVKLSKKVTNLAASPNTVSTTQYADEFVYQDNVLQYVLHEEGRVKIITPVATSTKIRNAGSAGANNVLSGMQGVFEYFVKDQLGNTRMVLTEEVQKEVYLATMELTSGSDPNLGTNEAKLFGKVDLTTGNPTSDNELVLTRTDKSTTLWTGNTSAKVTMLTASDATKKVGPNMILKVSAGDMIGATANYFYFSNDPTGSSNGVTDALTSLVSSLLGNTQASSLTKMNSSLIQSNLSATGGDFTNFINGHPSSGTNPNAPKAFLNVVFFDEQFNFVAPDPAATSVGSSFQRVSSPNDQNATSLLLQQKAPKNGWVYIYLSNESAQSVYFDNLTVSQDHGRIAEENHYYAFGQKIAGICTSAFNKPPANKFNYQGDYSEEEDNTGWNEFDLRLYDPQIGRWTGADPYDQFASPYVGMGNDPVNNVDPDGGGVGYNGINWLGAVGEMTSGQMLLSRAINTVAGALVGGVANSLANGWNWNNFGTGAAWGGVGGLGATFVPWGTVGDAIGNAGTWAWGLFSGNSDLVRLIFSGGALKASDNSAFKFAAENVKKDYGKSIKVELLDAKSSDYISGTINAHKNSSIVSLDIITHGSYVAFFMYQDGDKDKNVSMYDMGLTKFFVGTSTQKESGTIDDIDFNKFSNNAVIEIHGCKACSDHILPDVDNIAQDLSQKLFKAGKKNAVVIGHTTKANPNIYDDNTTKSQQDYRHDPRAAYYNGKLLFKTSKTGRISRKTINTYLKNKK